VYLYLLAFIYTVKHRETVEAWLSQANLGGVLINIRQYDDEILALLASHQPLEEERQKLCEHPAISSCEAKECFVFRVTTTSAPELVFRSFPLRWGEEWYPGAGRTVYLCLQSGLLSDQQISWLSSRTEIAEWRDMFDLTSMLVGR